MKTKSQTSPGHSSGRGAAVAAGCSTPLANPARLVLAALLATFCLLHSGCAHATGSYKDHSDAARSRELLGHWYDQYMQGLSYAQGDTVYRRDGTFSASYESVAPGSSAAEPTVKQKTDWSGKWRIQNAQLVEDITAASDFSRVPQDRPMIRAIQGLDEKHLLLMNATGNLNEYARRKPETPKVTFTEGNGR